MWRTSEQRMREEIEMEQLIRDEQGVSDMDANDTHSLGTVDPRLI